MMRVLPGRLAVALGCVLLLTAAAAGAQWHYLSGGRFVGIGSVGARVWAAGTAGLVVHSTDNGESWRLLKQFTGKDLVDIEFRDSLLGLAVSSRGVVFRTSDGGASWDSAAVDTLPMRIRFVQGDVVTADVWRANQVKRSRAAGIPGSWGNIPCPGGYPFLLDSLNGWDGYAGNVFRTRDAARHWNLIGQITSWYRVEDFVMADSMFGAAFAWYWEGYVLRSGWYITQNGGLSWDLRLNTSGERRYGDVDVEGRLFVVAGRNCAAVDRGQTYFSTLPADTASDINARFGDCAWLGNNGGIFRSTDHGHTWELNLASAELAQVGFADDSSGWAISKRGVYRTADAGRTWQQVLSLVPAAGRGLSGLAALSPTTAVVSGDSTTRSGNPPAWHNHFFILRTEDAGASWQTVHSNHHVSEQASALANRLCFVDPLLGWHPGRCGPGGNALRTVDGGRHWLEMAPIPDSSWREPVDVSFVDAANGWALGSRGEVWRTETGGFEWRLHAAGCGAARLQLLDYDNGWAVSDSGLWRTRTGGGTWELAQRPGRLRGLHFADRWNGVAVGDSGLVLRTTDGGETWLVDTCGLAADLGDVFVLDSAHAWGVGAGGIVLGLGDWASAVGAGRPEIAPRLALSAVPSVTRGVVRLQLDGRRGDRAGVIVRDIGGRAVARCDVRRGERAVTVDLRALPAGVYFVGLAGEPARAQRVVKLD